MNKEYKEYFEFLDAIRESGVTNMFGVVPYLQNLQKSFGIDKEKAQSIFKKWADSFNSEKENKEAL